MYLPPHTAQSPTLSIEDSKNARKMCPRLSGCGSQDYTEEYGLAHAKNNVEEAVSVQRKNLKSDFTTLPCQLLGLKIKSQDKR